MACGSEYVESKDLGNVVPKWVLTGSLVSLCGGYMGPCSSIGMGKWVLLMPAQNGESAGVSPCKVGP